MGDVVMKLIELGGRLLPFRLVMAWEVGLYFLAGKCRGVVGPGLKLIVPGLCDVRCVSVVPEVYTTPLQTVSLRDGAMLTFSASVTVYVADARLAYCGLGHWQETVVEMAAAVLAEGLADADPDRFDPARGKRDRLLGEQRDGINEAIGPHGLVATALRMNNFALGIRTIRLLTDRATLGERAAPV